MGRLQLPHLQSSDLIHVKCAKCETGAEPAQPLTQRPEKLSSTWAWGVSRRAVHLVIAPGLELIHKSSGCVFWGWSWELPVQKCVCPHSGLAYFMEFVSSPRSTSDPRLGRAVIPSGPHPHPPATL